jgi:hypothetical protein
VSAFLAFAIISFTKEFMKLTAMLLTSLACYLVNHQVVAGEPRGSLLELHSCELYAGGCVVSSEATLGGRYMLRAWTFTDGSIDGTDLAGLSLAALQASIDNLANPKADPGRVIVYLPDNASSAQRTALLRWLESSQPDLRPNTQFQTRTVPMHFAKTQTGYSFSAGEAVSVATGSLESCESGACGQALWYTPRASTSVFTVALDRSSKIHEPLLQLKWDDAGRRSIFLGRFGRETPARSLYVSSAELCGPTSALF